MAIQIAPFSSQHLEAACRVLADTDRGLSGTQIERLLQEIEVADSSPSRRVPIIRKTRRTLHTAPCVVGRTGINVGSVEL